MSTNGQAYPITRGNGGNYFYCNDAPLVWVLLSYAKYHDLALCYKKTLIYCDFVKPTTTHDTQFKRKKVEINKWTQQNAPAVAIQDE